MGDIAWTFAKLKDKFRYSLLVSIIYSNKFRYFWYTTTLCTSSAYLSTSALLIVITSNSDKHEFSSIWISCINDVMYDVDCVIKVTFTRREIIYVLKISVVHRFRF